MTKPTTGRNRAPWMGLLPMIALATLSRAGAAAAQPAADEDVEARGATLPVETPAVETGGTDQEAAESTGAAEQGSPDAVGETTDVPRQPSLNPPDESFFAAGEEGDEAVESPQGEPEVADVAPPGGGQVNPADALLTASIEEAEDREAKGEAEEVSWQEVASRFVDLNGYIRTRADLFYKLHLDRSDGAAFDLPLGDNVNPHGLDCVAGQTCFADDTIAGANMRLRLEPVIHLSSNVQVYATIDLLDNLVLGSTPEGYANQPGDHGGYALAEARSPWVPLRAFASTQVPPDGRNSFTDSVYVKRAWAEVTTPLGRIMFGRMQSHWGLGLLANAGNDIDSSYGDIADRIMLAVRHLGVVAALGTDFAGEGPTSRQIFEHQGQPYDLGQLDDVNQYFAVLGYRPPEEHQLARLRAGLPALAGGVYYVFRNQVLSGEGTDFLGNTDNVIPVLRDAWAHIGDGWFQFRYERFRAELEAVVIYGYIGNQGRNEYREPPLDVIQWGGVLQLEYTLLGQPSAKANRLRIGIEAGYASGDPDQEGLSPRDGILVQDAVTDDRTVSAFRFDPDYDVDLILFEQILGQVSAAHYVRPWVDYTLAIGVGHGKKYLTFRLDTIYSRASEFVSTLSNDPNLGLEIDAAILFETADNFVAMLQYGVFFPFGAYKDLPGVTNGQYDLGNAQTVQGMLAVRF